jgi:probable rRNA maturation factor
MPLTLAISEGDAEQVGTDQLQKLTAGYDRAFADLNLLADVMLVSLAEIQHLNNEQRCFDDPTDVLSFPTMAGFSEISFQAQRQPTLIGSVIIAPEKAIQYGESLIQLIHHGLLHLLGYDHETDFPAWLAEEKRILEILKSFDLDIPPVPYETV